MRRSRPTAIATALTLCALLAACEPAATPSYSGKLYFGSGNYLALIDLRNGSTDIVASIGDSEIREIGPKDGRRLLLSVFGPVNQKDSYRLVLFDLETRQQLTFFEGRSGRYLLDGQTLVYDDGARIWATRKRFNAWEKVEVAQHPYNAGVRIVPVSGTAFLYSAGEADDARVYLFDTDSRTSTELAALAGACTLDGASWIESRSELLCRADGSWVFTKLDGTVSESLQLPSDRSFRALAYMPDHDAVVFSERWQAWMSGRQKWAVWVYDIGSASSHRVMEHQYLGDSVIYKPY